MFKSARLISMAGLVAVGAAACGTSTATQSSSSGGGLASCSGTITVATDLPLTGGDATDGPFPQMAAELAVNQAIADKLLGGCTLKYISDDDSSVAQNGHDPAKGAANITALAANSSVVGVVGPFNSSVALAEIPVASMDHLPIISPANTNPCLTVAVPVCSDPTIKIDTTGLYPGVHSYFRVIASDVQQGEIDAYVATKVLNETKVYVLDDGQAYGRGIALLFSKYFQADGGSIVNGTSISMPDNTTSYATQISQAQSEGAQLIFFGGTTGDGCGLVRRDEVSGGLTLPFLSPDGCQDQLFITDSNSGSNSSAAEGAYATSAPDVTKLASSAAFYAAYAQAYASQPAPYNNAMNEPYSPYGYDAMNILLQAIKNVLTANGGKIPTGSQYAFRDDIIAQLHKITYSGALGTTSFDANGDTTNGGFTLYKVESGNWVGVNTYKVNGSGTVTQES
ncbi:MAG: branched-chain amino acid ABC transporter substrate-binding protein [Candidatus Dormiibacterota bacterium]